MGNQMPVEDQTCCDFDQEVVAEERYLEEPTEVCRKQMSAVTFRYAGEVDTALYRIAEGFHEPNLAVEGERPRPGAFDHRRDNMEG